MGRRSRPGVHVIVHKCGKKPAFACSFLNINNLLMCLELNNKASK